MLLVLHAVRLSSLQVVAAVQGKLLSIYDGITEYHLGQTLHAKRGGAAWAPLDACYFAFPSMQQVSAVAHSADFHDMCTSRLLCGTSQCCHARCAKQTLVICARWSTRQAAQRHNMMLRHASICKHVLILTVA